MPRKSAAKKGAITGANNTELKPRKLFDDSDNNSSEDDQDDGGAALTGGAGLKVNEEFAKRFEHNKKREELHRLQEKYGKGKDALEDSESDSSSDAETEDEAGFLITEDLDNEISATLQAIKNKDPRIYDKTATFYKPFEPEDIEALKEKKDKPVTIRDYHRERYMAGDVGAEEDTAAEPRTYVQEQDDLKKSIVNDFHNAAADDSEEWSDDEAFIKPRAKPQAQLPENGIHPSRQAAMKLTEVDVVNAEKDPEGYLEKFMKAKAWAPKDGPNWQAFESDDGEDNEDIAEQFEHAYNMRFEDPDKANEVLKSYSRSLVAAKSVRKEEVKGRKKLRQLEKEKKEADKAKRDEERRRLRRLKIGEAEEKLAKIKKAAGTSSKDISEDDLLKLLDDAWDDDKWEEEMKRRFGEEYYAEVDDGMAGEVSSEDEEEEQDASSKKKKPKKPKWDDDIEIKDIIPDFEEKAIPKVSLSDLEDEEAAAAANGADAEAEQEDQDSDEEDRPAKKRKTTKDIKKEKAEAKREARRELAAIEALVDTKMELDAPRALTGASSVFRYRETSPISFGMTPRDILLAPSDQALNEFAGLKKLASFRDPEKKKKDKKRLGKKARLRQWRKETFGPEFERTGPTFGFAAVAGEEVDANAAAQQQGGGGQQPAAAAVNGGQKEEPKEVDGVVHGERKKRKRSKGKKKPAVEA
ncbi:KRI1-like family C-terminal-domain-containing protein [Coniochaeta sp. 2T2.1]|nr:KRI1-like family C-terminal-domain-containing protein [Coniochaeta sp. 2T2.1]